jgi:hypothetical protein
MKYLKYLPSHLFKDEPITKEILGISQKRIGFTPVVKKVGHFGDTLLSQDRLLLKDESGDNKFIADFDWDKGEISLLLELGERGKRFSSTGVVLDVDSDISDFRKEILARFEIALDGLLLKMEEK